MANSKLRSEVAENWVSYPRSMVECPALRVLSRAVVLAMHRIELEHMVHGGAENGRLQVTRRQFEEWGVHRDAIGPAIREIAALGFAEVTEHGHAGVGGHGVSNRFRLTYVNTKSREQPTNEWQLITTIEEAERIARAARENKDQRARDIGARGGRATRKRFFSATETMAESATEKPWPTRGIMRPRKPWPLSIISESGGGGDGGHTPSVDVGNAPPAAGDAALSPMHPRVTRRKARVRPHGNGVA